MVSSACGSFLSCVNIIANLRNVIITRNIVLGQTEIGSSAWRVDLLLEVVIKYVISGAAPTPGRLGTACAFHFSTQKGCFFDAQLQKKYP
jgi:hypothetical protein